MGWYDRINNAMPVQQPQMQPYPQQTSAPAGARSNASFNNPMQRMSQMMQAMQNPMAFVRQNLKGIPEELFNDPTGNSILQYMQSNMGVTQQDIRNAESQIPRY